MIPHHPPVTRGPRRYHSPLVNRRKITIALIIAAVPVAILLWRTLL